MSRLFGLVPAAGGGARFGTALPKQYAQLGAHPVIEQTLRRLTSSLHFARVVVALAADDPYFTRWCARLPAVESLVCGGVTRATTVRNALAVLAAECADDDWVLVHDAARPCVPRDALLRLVENLRDDAVGGLLAIPVADTLKRSDRDSDCPTVMATEERAHLWQAQTPQMFRFGVLQTAFADPAALACTDESQAVERLGRLPRLIRGSPANIKITYPEDLAMAEAILHAQAATESAR